MEFWERQNFREMEQISGFQGLHVGQHEGIQNNGTVAVGVT